MNEIGARWTITQPWRGIFGFAVCLMVALGITAAFPKMEAFLGLMMCWAVCIVAPEVILGLVWQGKWPAEKLDNPWRGFGMTAFMFVLGTLALWFTLHFIGGGNITPVYQHYIIMTVVVALFLVVAFGCWPFMGRVSVPAAGFFVLILTYLVTLAIFMLWGWKQVIVAAKLPFQAAIIPWGPFNPDSAVTFGVMMVMWLFVFVLLDMWPLYKAPAIMKQPVLGIVLLVCTIVLSIITWAITRWVMGMAQYEILIKVVICTLFGFFIILPMLQTWPGRKWAQPAKGFINIAVAIVLAIVAFFAVKALGMMFTGVPFGAKAAYPADYLWMATFMLGLVFPAMFCYGPMWDFWPLPPTPPPPGQ